MPEKAQTLGEVIAHAKRMEDQENNQEWYNGMTSGLRTALDLAVQLEHSRHTMPLEEVEIRCDLILYVVKRINANVGSIREDAVELLSRD